MKTKQFLEALGEVFYSLLVGAAMGLPFAFIIVKGCQATIRSNNATNERLDRMERRLQALELQREDTAK